MTTQLASISWFLNTIPYEKEISFLRERAWSRSGQEKDKVRLGHYVPKNEFRLKIFNEATRKF